jgi:hypothetical protein
MKKISHYIILCFSFLLYQCTTQENESIEPQTAQSLNVNRNLRPTTGEKPDLIIYAFTRYGSISQDATNYYIPVNCSERNIGTAADTGAYSDTLKVYQKMPVGSGILPTYKYRLVDKFVRNRNLIIGDIYYFVAPVKFPKSFRPTSGLVNLVIVADGGSRIFESNESNNMSTTIWSIPLP